MENFFAFINTVVVCQTEKLTSKLHLIKKFNFQIIFINFRQKVNNGINVKEQ